MFHLSCLSLLVLQFFCGLGFRTGFPSSSHKTLIRYSCEVVAAVTMHSLSLLYNIIIDSDC
jgi:hypothetical protein